MAKLGLMKSVSAVSGMTFLSRILGFIRDVVVAQFFGASAGYDAFLIAFKIPNFMRRLFAEGAFAQAFIPILSEYKTQSPPEEVRALINKVFGSLSLVLFCITVLGMIFSSNFIHLFAPGFEDSGRHLQAAQMLQITFPYIFFISLTAFAGGILNTYGHFRLPAFTPVLLNICLIGAAVGLGPHLSMPVHSLAWGVLAGGVVQLAIQGPALYRLGFLPKPQLDWQDKGVRRILHLMGPAVIGASVYQINLLVDSIFASFLPVGSVSWLYYSERLMEFPLGMFGVALATVILPHLSEKYAKRSEAAFSASLDWALRWAIFIGVPAAIGLGALGLPILATLFQYGRFEAHDVLMAAWSLLALSGGLVAFICVKVLVSAFYARQNTSLPVKVAAVALLSNIILNFVFIGPFAHAGLALASTLSSWLNASLLLWVLHRTGQYKRQPGWGRFFAQVALASAAMLIVLQLCTPDQTVWLAWGLPKRALTLSLLMGLGGLTYFSAVWGVGLRSKQLRLAKSATA